MTPDMTAETGDGASGWAYGSQMWNGKIPAFVPNPSRANPNVAERIAGSETGTAANPLKENEPVVCTRNRNARRMPPVPMCVAIR